MAATSSAPSRAIATSLSPEARPGRAKAPGPAKRAPPRVGPQGLLEGLLGPGGRAGAFAGGPLDVTALIKDDNLDPSKYIEPLLSFLKDPGRPIGRRR